jgi:hypothetical protein
VAETKTKRRVASVDAFIGAVEPPAKREDARVLDALFRRATGEEPAMWGPTIIGDGAYHYRCASGHEGDMCRVGFSPRKVKHSPYLACEFDGSATGEDRALLGRLGKHSLGNGGCLYVNKLADIDLSVLEEMVALGWRSSFERWPAA